MSPEFAKSVDRVFIYVLDLLDRIARGDSVDVSQVRTQILDNVSRAEKELSSRYRSEWLLAKYALVCWIDELLIREPWPGAEKWNEAKLEFELFNLAERATQFFTKAKEALLLPNRDALEVFYVCAVLGFRGIYYEASPALLGEFGLPPDLASWAQEVHQAIHLSKGRPTLPPRAPTGPGAPPLDGKFQLFAAALATGGLAIVTAVVAFLMLRGEG